MITAMVEGSSMVPIV